MTNGSASIARRLLVAVIGAGITAMVVVFLLGYGVTYAAERRSLLETVSLIEESYLPAIERAVFTFDVEQVDLLLRGITLIPEIASVTISDPTVDAGDGTESLLFTAGTVPAGREPLTRLSLQIQTDVALRDLGVIEIYDDRDVIAGRLAERLVLLSIAGAVAIGLIAAFLDIVISRTMVNDLRRIAAYVESLNVHGIPVPRPPLREDWSRPEDEIDEIARVLDEMHGRLVKTYEDLSRSIQERETLLHELYHRTKNNMQVIISMLRLRASKFPDNTVVEGFVNDVERRVAAMALVHQQLYQSQDLSQLELNRYVLELVEQIRAEHIGRPAKIAADTEETPCPIPIDKAIPCGLAINELVTNALLHGFPQDLDREGSVVVRVRMPYPEEVRVEIRDNGTGLAPEFSSRRDADLGLQTVRALVETQLAGEFVIRNNPGEHAHGVECVVTFPREVASPGT